MGECEGVLAQCPDEQVTDYGCRLETALDQAFEGSAFPQGNPSVLLCERLWSDFGQSLKGLTPDTSLTLQMTITLSLRMSVRWRRSCLCPTL